MLLAALRSERNKASGGARVRPEVLAPWGGPVPGFAAGVQTAKPAQCQGEGVAPRLTSAPKVGQQPVPPRTHAPRVPAVLLAEGLRELQVREDVRPVVAGEGHVDLRAGLREAHTAVRPGDRPPRSAPPPLKVPGVPYLVVPGLGVGAQAAARGVCTGLVLPVDIVTGLRARGIVQQPWGTEALGPVAAPPCPLIGGLASRVPSEEGPEGLSYQPLPSLPP